jgi:aspartate-semialdehyde dehydrogenase
MKPALLLDTDPHIEVMAEAEKKKEEEKQEEEEMKLLSTSRCRLSLVRIQCGACSWPDEAQRLYTYIINKEEREKS